MANRVIPTDLLAAQRSGYGTGGSMPGSSASERPTVTVVRFPPWERPIRGATDFNHILPRLAVAAGATVRDEALIHRVREGNAAVVKYVTIFVDAPTADLDVAWRLTVAGSPVPGWENLRSFPRAANNLSITFEGNVRVPPNAEIAVEIVNESLLPWTVGAQYGGWEWSVNDARRLFGDEDY